MNLDALLLLPVFLALIIAARWLDQNHNDNDKEDKTNDSSSSKN